MRETALLVGNELGIPMTFVVSARAARIALRADSRTGGALVTVPRGLAAEVAASFVRRNAGWIRSRLAEVGSHVPFAPGSVLPLLGIDRTIREDAASDDTARLCDGPDGPAIHIAPGADADRSVAALLHEEALHHLTSLTHVLAASVGLPRTAVSVEDHRSRWGRCERDGRISFSWRLALAPTDISGYVVAHEVAHLAEMNHGPRFWSICAELSPLGRDEARDWLKENGQRLRRYGPPLHA